MAEDQNLGTEWVYDYTPWTDPKQIKSGLKKVSEAGTVPPNVDPAVDSSLQTAACQYWVKGLPGVCSNWDGEQMKCIYDISTETPTGYGFGDCDRLGRRQWCSKYQFNGKNDPEKYVCVLPSVERSAAGKYVRIDGSDSTSPAGLKLQPWNPEEIKGYNPTEDERREGQCDGKGLGRGKPGMNKDGLEVLQTMSLICKHYKPHIMGFGAINPRPYHGNPPSPIFIPGQTYIPQTARELFDGSAADPLIQMSRRLPYNFTIYNMRAQYQKCGHWSGKYGGTFEYDDSAVAPQLKLDDSPEEYCRLYAEDTISKDEVAPFIEIREDTDMPFILWYVWGKQGTAICNGAKPECPCYTGRWIYCIDRNMQDGMRITANQILELRFWVSNWGSIEEYNRYFEQKPGPTQNGFADVTTPDIYTFTKWENFGLTDISESIMRGNKHSMKCFPAPAHEREFIPSIYTEVTPVTYPKAGAFEGTTTESQVAFPNLIRELEMPDKIYPDIFVLYPYNTKNPWDFDPCNYVEELCVHSNNIMYGAPRISVVGFTVQDVDIWVLNSTYIIENRNNFSTGPLNTMKQYVRANSIPDNLYEKFCSDLYDLIKEAQNTGTEGIISGHTDSETGFFMLDNLALVNNKLNELFVIIRFSEGTFAPMYSYIYRKVESKYYGALISQEYFNQETSGENNLPSYFFPAGEIKGSVSSVGGVVSSVLSCAAIYVPNRRGDQAKYSYCLNKYNAEQIDLKEWVQIGPTGYIWIEIPEKDINYLWGFEVEEVKALPSSTGKVHICGVDSTNSEDVSINFDVVELSAEIKKQIPPNVVIVKSSSNLKSFFNSDWKINIKYKYNKFENKLATTIDGGQSYFPQGISNDPGAGVKFFKPSWNIAFNKEDNSFKITNVLGGVTIAIMAFVVDENGRIQTAAATKMLTYGYRVACRNVDITYSYQAQGSGWTLQPSTGFFTWIGDVEPGKKSRDGRIHSSMNKCGDHECDRYNCIGPMWFPFDSCSTWVYYSISTGAGSCGTVVNVPALQSPYIGSGAWRYGLPNVYEAWVTPGGNWAASCGSSFTYHYSIASADNAIFTGKARIRGPVNERTYRVNQWALPPFGNTGREIVERWIFRDVASFFSVLTYKTEWVPVVFDMEDIVSELNCFAHPGVSSDPRLSEPFFHRSMVSNYLAAHVSEELEQDFRVRFEDHVEVVNNNSAYPWPSGYRYKFTNEETAWLWPEYWKDIERGLENTDKLGFMFVYRPDYYFDLTKKRHRFITEEGVHTLYFYPPEEYSGESGSDGEPIEVYASISLDGVNKRYFQIIYDEYDSTLIDWQDESGSGEVGGSGENSIYENANNGPGSNGFDSDDEIRWIHDFNTIFDSGASIEPNEDRKAYIGRTSSDPSNVWGYYNRGLIINIPRSKLNLLPIEETLLEDPEVSGTIGAITSEDIICNWTIEFDEGCPVRIVVKGKWGITEEPDPEATKSGEMRDVLVCRPLIVVTERETDIYFVSALTGYNESYPENKQLENYEVEIELSTYPNRIMRPAEHLKIRLGIVSGENLWVDSVQVYSGKYKKASENIKVWEQKFIRSKQKGTFSNADGPDSDKYRISSGTGVSDGGGQYFPAQNPSIFTYGGTALSKTTLIYAGEGHVKDINIPINISNLTEVESQEQQKLYEAALSLEKTDNDTLIFSRIFPPDIGYFLRKVLSNTTIFEIANCSLKCPKLGWHGHPLFKSFVTGTFFQPGGHYFKWGSNYLETRCYIIGNVSKVYEADMVHYKHGSDDPTVDAGSAYYGRIRQELIKSRLQDLSQ